ncbi:MAG: (p)ppGpp synthetase, partial [Bacilli bacterium]|nr:(p)ppGpp synthetase [Bacilli bacterium]
ALNLAPCCTPIPGDDIIGYITRGKGITVHRRSCPNVLRENERLIDVFWRDDLEYSTHPVDIVIESLDRPNLLVEIVNCLTSAKVSINSIHARLASNGNAVFSATILVSDAKRLSDIFNILHNVSGVYNVSRVIH